MTTAHTIEEALAHKETVTSLDLYKQEMTVFPKEILELPALRSIQIITNELTELPDWLENTKLTYIYVNTVKISKIGKLPKTLQEFYISESQLTEFPNSLVECENLTKLFLFDNNISFIPSNFYLPKLTHLDLSHNQLTEVPIVLGSLKKITLLNLSNNNISFIPSNFCLPKLTYLYLSNNQLTEIPIVLSNLEKLTLLNLNNNNISFLPNIFDKLNLQYLLLTNNKLTKLPSSLLQGEKNTIHSLYLNQNPFETSLPEIFLSPDYDEITLNEFDEDRFTIKDTRNYDEIPFNQVEQGPIKDARKLLNKALNSKKFSYETKVDVYNIFITPITKLNTLPFESFFKALQVSYLPIQTIAFQYITKNWEDKLKQSPLHKDMHIAVLGKVNFDKKDLKKRLKNIGVIYSTKISHKTTHVILEKDITNYENYDREGLVFLPEQSLQKFLDEVDPLYLNKSQTSKEEIKKVQNLLMGVNEDTVNVGLEMLKKLGVPQEIITELFLVHKNLAFSLKTRNQAQKLLLLNCSEQLKLNLQTFKDSFIISNHLGFHIQLEIYRLTKKTEIDLKKVVDYVTRYFNGYELSLAKFLKNSNDNLQYIKKCIENYTNVYISSADFTDLSNIFKLSKSLKHLTINSLEEYDFIKEKLYTLSELECLGISSLNLTELPPHFEQLSKLKKLILSNNHFEIFPTELEKMPKLNEIHMHNNPFTEKNSQKPNDTIFELDQYPHRITRKQD